MASSERVNEKYVGFERKTEEISVLYDVSNSQCGCTLSKFVIKKSDFTTHSQNVSRNRKILTYFLFKIEESTNETETDVEDNSTESDDGAVDTDQDNDSNENDTEDSQESDNDAKDTDDQVIMSSFFMDLFHI